MKLNEYEIKKIISSKNASGVYFFTGDPYLVKVYSERLAHSSVTADSFDFYPLDGASVTFQQLFEACSSYPIAGDTTSVFLKSLDLTSFKKKDLETFQKIISGIPSTALLVITLKEMTDKKDLNYLNVLLNDLSKNYSVADLTVKTSRDLSLQAVKWAKKYGKELTPADASFFVTYVGTDMTNMANELKKLCCFSDDGKIKRSDITAICTPSDESRIFDIVKHINSGRTSDAYREISLLLKEGEEPVKIAAVIANGYSDIYRGLLCAGSQSKISETSKAYGYGKNDFRLKNASRDAGKYSLSDIRKTVSICLDYDRKMKSTSSEKTVLLEEMIFDLSHVKN